MTVRLIAKVYWAAHPNGQDHLSPEDPRISVLHHFLGSWKSIGGWRAEAIPVKGFYHIMKGLLHLRYAIFEHWHLLLLLAELLAVYYLYYFYH
jgi:hypothetical protein